MGEAVGLVSGRGRVPARWCRWRSTTG